MSASADDGKTATSVNLSVVAARAEQRVVLVDGAVVVLQHEKSTRREIVAVERLVQVGVPVLGTVMRAIRTGSDTYYHSYHHNFGYCDPDGHGVAGQNGNGNGSRSPVRGGRAPSR